MTQRQLRWHKPSQFVSWVSNQDQPDKTTCLKSLLRSHNGRSRLTRWLVIGGVLFVSPHSASAQRIPIADDTLGNERSLVSPNTVINNLPSNQIDGGAQRGANLFHSFREFNVDTGQGVYFTNPAGIANILTRVTGGNQSQILGTLGVLGNANLFLINPNGILFGPNAQLDISGSFLASTANSFKFPDGSEFSATNPQAPPLLTINVPLGLQYGSTRLGTTITNRGDLRTGQDLQLMADKLDLQGQLIAGRDLVLQAQDTVVVRDTVLNSFVARSGGNLTIQGNQGIDILALSHPQYTAFISGTNLSLLSDGLISGDAHFSSGGDFRIQSLSGQLANFTSLYDPIISSTGNVDVAANYSGASLLIESQGSVRVQGTVTIDAPDTVSTFVGEDAVLQAQPGLIIRSGQTSLVYGGTSQNNPSEFTGGTVPAGITLASAVRVQPNAQGGVVKLTAAEGGITFHSIDASSRTGGNGGTIALRAKGDITNTGSFLDPFGLSATLGSFSYTTTGDSGNGGSITLISTLGNITLNNFFSPSYSHSTSGNAGSGGNISFTSDSGNITLTNWYSNSNSESASGNAGLGGNITFSTGSGDITLANSGLGAFSRSDSGNAGLGGNITLSTDSGDITLTKSGLESFSRSNSGNAGLGGNIVLFSGSGDITLKNASLNAVSVSNSGTTGNGGTISLITNSGSINLTDATVSSFSDTSTGRSGESISGDIVVRGRVVVLNNSTLKSGTLSSGRAGNILIQGGRVDLLNGTNIVVEGKRDGGSASVTAATLTLSGVNDRDRPSQIVTNVLGNGNGGAIQVAVENLALQDGAAIASTVTGDNTGQGGNISINADVISLSGTSPDGSLPSRIATATFSSGDAGDLTINTREIIVQSGALVSTSSLSRTLDAGRSGNLTINASDSISLSGTAASGQIPSVLSTGSFGSGTSGVLRLNTKRLTVQDGAAVSVATFGTALGGQMIINASDFVVLSGTAANGFASGLYAQTFGSGNAGNLQVTTGQLIVQERATITAASGSAADTRVPTGQPNFSIPVNTGSPGNAGNLMIAANILRLDRQGQLLASTSSGEGGNINITVSDLLLLRRNSLISATAGRAQAGGDGGNITFNGNFIVAVPKENSDISANAYIGNGGRVDVTAQGIFGTQFRPQLTPLSDITASSTLGAPGTVAINTPDVDPNRGLVQLPTDITDASRLIAQTCPTGDATAKQPNEFIITGRGGLPPTPSDAVNRDAIQVDLVTTNAQDQPSVSPNQPDQTSSPRATPPTGLIHTPLVEAQSWQIGADGRVVLVAAAPTKAIAPSPNRLVHCN